MTTVDNKSFYLEPPEKHFFPKFKYDKLNLKKDFSQIIENSEITSNKYIDLLLKNLSDQNKEKNCNNFVSCLRTLILENKCEILKVLNEIYLKPSITEAEKLLGTCSLLLFNYDFSGSLIEHGDLLVAISENDYQNLKHFYSINANKLYTSKLFCGKMILGNPDKNNLDEKAVNSYLNKPDKFVIVKLIINTSTDFISNYISLDTEGNFLIAPGTMFTLKQIPKEQELNTDSRVIDFELENELYSMIPQIAYDYNVIESKQIYSKPNECYDQKNQYYFIKLLFSYPDNLKYKKALCVSNISSCLLFLEDLQEGKKYLKIALTMLDELKDNLEQNTYIEEDKPSKEEFYKEYLELIYTAARCLLMELFEVEFIGKGKEILEKYKDIIRYEKYHSLRFKTQETMSLYYLKKYNEHLAGCEEELKLAEEVILLYPEKRTQVLKLIANINHNSLLSMSFLNPSNLNEQRIIRSQKSYNIWKIYCKNSTVLGASLINQSLYYEKGSKEAIELNEKALQIYTVINPKHNSILTCYENLYFNLEENDFLKAVEYVEKFFQSYLMMEKTPKKVIQYGSLCDRVGYSYYKQKDYLKAEEYLKLGLKELDENNETKNMNYARINQHYSLIAYKNDNKKDYVKLNQIAIDIELSLIKENPHMRETLRYIAYYNIGNYYKNEQMENEAGEAFELAAESAYDYVFIYPNEKESVLNDLFELQEKCSDNKDRVDKISASIEKITNI